jgi:hypothetical protein
MKTGETDNTAEAIVRKLLGEVEGDEAADFMRDVGFDRGEMYTLQDLDIIKEELERFQQKVIKRTIQLMPHLVKRGIVENSQAHIVAKLVTYETATQEYDPKRWHEKWQKAWRKIRNVIRSSLGW